MSASTPKKTFLLLGHSHANCLTVALKSKAFTPRPDSVFRIVGNGHDALPGGPVLVDAMKKEIANPIVTRALSMEKSDANKRVYFVSALYGQHFSRMGLFAEAEPYAVIHPDDDGASIPPGARLVPYDAICDIFRRKLEPMRRLFEIMPRETLAGVMHLDAPPPVPDSDYIKRNLSPQSLRVARARGVKDEDLRINDASVRLALWKCQRDVVRAICADLDVTYVAPPAEALDDAGFRAPFAWKDAVHASTAYGVLALGAIEQAADGADTPKRAMETVS